MISITNNIDAFSNTLMERGGLLNERLIATINQLTAKMQVNILQGDSPASNPHRRKGWLANSVRPVPATSTGTEVSGGIEAGGGDAWYAKLFEYGTSRAYNIAAVNKKALMFEYHGEQIMVKHLTQQHPPFDAGKLAFMHPMLVQMEEEIRATIQAATLEALSGK
jgi:hypothetical protein